MKMCTDIKQSKQLAEILPLESADMHYVRKTHDFRGNPIDGEWSHPKYGNPDGKYAEYVVQNFSSYEKLPCWSLAALLDAMPPIQELCSSTDHYYRIHCMNLFSEWHENAIDSCVEMIIKLYNKQLL